MPDTKIELTERGLKNINAMYTRVEDVAAEYGCNSDEYKGMLKSLLSALVGVFRLGGRIMAEDDLSLLIDSWITVGCIWHAKHLGEGKRDPLLGEWVLHS